MSGGRNSGGSVFAGPAVFHGGGSHVNAPDHGPDAQASAHGWKCLDLCCPDRVPKRGPTPPVCYTCGKAMALIYAPPVKAEQDLAPYVTTGVLSPEEVWEQTRLEEPRPAVAVWSTVHDPRPRHP